MNDDEKTYNNYNTRDGIKKMLEAIPKFINNKSKYSAGEENSTKENINRETESWVYNLIFQLKVHD